MPYEDFQNDLFGGQERQSKPKKKGFSDRRFLPSINIPLEYTVIIAVIVMVLVIIAYAIGVEKGKSVGIPALTTSIYDSDIISGYTSKEKPETVLNVEAKDVPEKSIPIDVFNAVEDEAVSGDESRKTVQVEKEVVKDTMPVSVYTVQLASFKDIESALGVLKRLKEAGISAEYAQRGDWYQVYATGYQTIEEAKKAQADLMPKFSDCFIRKIQ